MKTVAPGWWANFYTGLFIEGVLSRETDAIQTVAEAAFVEAALQLSPPAQILDLACNVGRHSLELAAWDYEMTGLDFAQPFLEQARANAGPTRTRHRLGTARHARAAMVRRVRRRVLFWWQFRVF